MLSEARKAGVQAIFLSDHHRPPRDFIRDSWRGLREGVLFVPGSEANGFLLYPARSIMQHMNGPTAALIEATRADGGLIFLSHIEERPGHSMAGLDGMEIYNRHFDAKKDAAGLLAITVKLTAPASVRELEESLAHYPDELFGAQVQYPAEYLAKWDAETQTRRLTGVAANDCHHNFILLVKMVEETTVKIGTNVDSDDEMRSISARLRPWYPRAHQGTQTRRHPGADRPGSLQSVFPQCEHAHSRAGAERARPPRRSARRPGLRQSRLDVRPHGVSIRARQPGWLA